MGSLQWSPWETETRIAGSLAVRARIPSVVLTESAEQSVPLLFFGLSAAPGAVLSGEMSARNVDEFEQSPASVGPFAILRHDLPGGGWHFDWLLAREPGPLGPDARRLIAFRVEMEPERAIVGAEGLEGFGAERLPDHRWLYLSFEGSLPPSVAESDRGSVRRVLSGTCQIHADREDALAFRLDSALGSARFLARRLESANLARWEVYRAPEREERAPPASRA